MIMEGAGVFLYWFWKSHLCPWNEARCHLRSQGGCSKGQSRFIRDVFGGTLFSWLSVALRTDDAPSSFAAQHRPWWGAERGTGEHKVGAGMSVEPLICISYLYSCGKSVLLDSYSVSLWVKIKIWVEFVVHIWIYVFLCEATLLFLALLIWRE